MAMAGTSSRRSSDGDTCAEFCCLFLAALLGLAAFATLFFCIVLWPLAFVLPGCFNCNEVVSGSVSSISHLPTLPLQPPLCDVHVQTTSWNDTISSIQCASVAGCDLDLSECVGLQIAVNHYNRDRCMHLVLSPRDVPKLGWVNLSYQSVDWWWQFGKHALLLVAFTIIGTLGVILLRRMHDSLDFKPWFSPRRAAGDIDTELAMEQASLIKGRGT